jgi:predicted aldo/keto reductase-like oxidoreductase
MAIVPGTSGAWKDVNNRLRNEEQEKYMIPKLAFGRSGHLSTRTLFGAAAFSQVSQAEADQTMEVLFKYGVNHIDTAASYGDAELRLGPWIARHRNDFFLASKTGDRTYQEAKESIHRSLERLQTDHLDLIQLHAVIEDDEWEVALGPGGALAAVVEARQQGLVRFIGITSHTLHAPIIHMRSLEKFDFDSVLLPYNFMLMQNPAYAADFEALYALAQTKNVAVQLIKTIQRRPWRDQSHFAVTWYEPFTDRASIDLAIHWALGRSGAFINTAGDIHVLPKVLAAASCFDQVPSSGQMQAMLQSQAAEPLWA